LEVQPDAVIIFFSGKTGFDHVRSAMQKGAYDYVPKDSGPDELRHVFSKALEHRKLKTQKQQSQHELKTVYKNHVMIGKSAPSADTFRNNRATTSLPVPVSPSIKTAKSDRLSRSMRP